MTFKITNKTTIITATCLLIFMAGLAFCSILRDSNSMDELAHIPAGYSYISQQDMRLNPEHPTLLKDLAGFSAWLGSKITNTPIYVPLQVKSWQEDLNGQWDWGREFLFRSGNNANMIILWSRLPMILLTILLGFYVFKWAREIYGNEASLLALFLYSLSPTFLAHGRYVTTDVGAAAAFFIAAYYVVKWLRKPNTKNMVIAGIVLGLALLTKFSLILLAPYCVFLIVVWILVKSLAGKKEIFTKEVFFRTARSFGKILIPAILVAVIALVVIWPAYQFHVWNYPPERQLADTQLNLRTFGRKMLADPVIWMSDKPILRPYGQFFLGLLMVVQRAVGGNTTYFLGEISNTGWIHYFPVVFLIKVPLALLILMLIALAGSIRHIKMPFWKKPCQRLSQCIKDHFSEFALFSLFALYWIVTLRSNLNIGVRHILPTFPVIYIIISGVISKWTNNRFRQGLLIILLLWYAAGTILVYPHFLTYFNELVGGPSNGYRYVTDSNLDWGQDLRRLTDFVEENNIETIYVDYFGGDSPEYRLGAKFQSWWGDRDPNDLSSGDWIAVSATFLQGGRGTSVPGFDQKTGYYTWLNQYTPITVIGNSIFVYKID